LPIADLSITKSGSPNPVGIGQPYVYNVVVRNNGTNIATGVMCQDAIPADVLLSSITVTLGTYSYSNHMITWDVGVLFPGEAGKMEVIIVAQKTGSVSSTATAYFNNKEMTDPIPDNNKATFEITVAPAVDLSPENITEFLEQIQEISNKMNELTLLIPGKSSTDNTNHLQLLTRKINQLPERDLNEISKLFHENPDWNRLPDLIEDIIIKVKMYHYECTQDNAKLNQPNFDYFSGNCPYGPTQVMVNSLLIGVAAADLATAIATAAANTIAIFSDKGNKIALAIAGELEVVAKELAFATVIVQREADVLKECTDSAMGQLLLNMYNTIITIESKIDDTTDKYIQVDQKLDVLLKLTERIKNDIGEILLHQIEDALSECKKFVSLELTGRYMGSLEQVQKIVRNYIDLAKLSGLAVGNAETYYNQGSNAYQNNQNEKALHWFMMSYHQLQFKDIGEFPCKEDTSELKLDDK
jgi:uncharacterized repeat protein (TIGR01451 family)